MSFSSFYAGLTGLKAHAVALNAIGNNLANVNTVGYKASRVSFSELFATSSGGFGVNGAGMPNQVGAGVQIGAIQQMFAQGAMQPSDVTTDLAIQGGGFFALKTKDGAPVYSRAGNFSFDNTGFLVDPNGFRVQGYTARNAAGQINASGQASDIQIPAGLTATPQATSYFQIDLNLNAAAQLDNPMTAQDEAATFSTSVTVFDTKGTEHNVTLVMTPTAAGQWTYEARIPTAEVAAPVSAGSTYQVIGSGNISFDANGKLATPATNVTLSVPAFSDGAPAMNLEWRLYDPATNSPTVTGYTNPSGVNNLAQDGYAMGRLQALSVGADGTISGVFTNGQTLGLAQLAIASFNSPDGLVRRGENTYQASIGSGPAALGGANSGGRGKISSRSLELSNVDITDQFTDLIITERGYQANSRVITTTDTIMQEALRLKQA